MPPLSHRRLPKFVGGSPLTRTPLLHTTIHRSKPTSTPRIRLLQLNIIDFWASGVTGPVLPTSERLPRIGALRFWHLCREDSFQQLTLKECIHWLRRLPCVRAVVDACPRPSDDESDDVCGDRHDGGHCCSDIDTSDGDSPLRSQPWLHDSVIAHRRRQGQHSGPRLPTVRLNAKGTRLVLSDRAQQALRINLIAKFEQLNLVNSCMGLTGDTGDGLPRRRPGGLTERLFATCSDSEPDVHPSARHTLRLVRSDRDLCSGTRTSCVVDVRASEPDSGV